MLPVALAVKAVPVVPVVPVPVVLVVLAVPAVLAVARVNAQLQMSAPHLRSQIAKRLVTTENVVSIAT